jgi:phosphonate transport system permease protein
MRRAVYWDGRSYVPSTMHDTHGPSLPPRIDRDGAWRLAALLSAFGFVFWAAGTIGFSLGDLITGLPNMGRILSEMMPPDTTRLWPIGRALGETFLMAIVGAALGIAGAFGLALLAARQLTPHVLCYHLARGLIGFFRTVPDLVWAIFFVATVGLGPFAGTLTIIVDTIGFCGRFFAEAMEEVDPGPQEALAALGAGRAGVVFCAVVPAAMPSFINSALFSLEKAVRSSVILGIVGAGGIGIELKVAMDMFEYSRAATIILALFALVLCVEHTSAWLRRRVI